MPVTVDQQPLAAEELGLNTVGQVLTHLQKDCRIVVHVLIDGEEPDLRHLTAAKQTPLSGHTLYIETADPRQLALEALDEIESQLDEAERLKADAVDLLQQNQTVRAMEKLGACFTTWQNAQDALSKTAELLRIDLSRVQIDGSPLTQLFEEIAQRLRDIRAALERRDFVWLGDVLQYETNQTTAQWRSALDAMRQTIASLH